ncbi:MAG: hypothetical protein V3V30_03660 [Parvularculaceae bacterium]
MRKVSIKSISIHVAVFVLLLLVVAAWLSQPKSPSVSEPKNQSENHREKITYDIKNNSDGGFDFTIERAAENPKKLNPTGNTHQFPRSTDADLLAQERMAHWTLWIGIFTAFGLGTIIYTLHEAHLTAEHAADILELEKKPFLGLRPILENGISWDILTENFFSPVNCVIENNGRSTAIVRRIYRRWSCHQRNQHPTPITDFSEPIGYGDDPKSIAFSVGPSQRTPPINSREDVFVNNMTGAPNVSDWIYFDGYIEFTDVSGAKWFRSGFCYVMALDSKRGMHMAMIPDRVDEHIYQKPIPTPNK